MLLFYVIVKLGLHDIFDEDLRISLDLCGML